MEDDLRPEYDLKKLQLRKVGKQRHQGKTIHLEPDVAAMFPDDNSVNEALRFLIRMTMQNKDLFSKTILEKALDIYCEQDNKKYQVYVLFELTFVYSFNGKTKEGFLAQQEIIRIAKQLDLPEDDPLYSYVSHVSQISDEGLDKMQSKLHNMNDKFGFIGRLMGNAMKGKWQSYLFVFVWLIMFLPGLALTVIFSPVWLPIIIYQMWQQRNRSNEQ